MTRHDKAREARVRRLANRFGLQLVRSRSRTAEMADFGCYAVVDPYSNTLVFGEGPAGYGASLDDAEEWLRSD